MKKFGEMNREFCYCWKSHSVYSEDPTNQQNTMKLLSEHLYSVLKACTKFQKDIVKNEKDIIVFV